MTRRDPGVNRGPDDQHQHRTPALRHDGASDQQAARWLPEYIEGRERKGRTSRDLTVGDVSKVLAAIVGDTAPEEPSAAWCPWCQEQWQERIHMYPRVRIRADLSWDCGWCGASAGAILDDPARQNLFDTWAPS